MPRQYLQSDKAASNHYCILYFWQFLFLLKWNLKMDLVNLGYKCSRFTLNTLLLRMVTSSHFLVSFCEFCSVNQYVLESNSIVNMISHWIYFILQLFTPLRMLQMFEICKQSTARKRPNTKRKNLLNCLGKLWVKLQLLWWLYFTNLQL